MLKIRPFQKGADEDAYVRLFNTAFSDYDDMRGVTLEEVKIIEDAPSFNLDGLLLAEWNGQIAGMVQAHVDEHRTEKKGFIQYLAVLPEFRRKGLAKKLLSTAVACLKDKGMKVATAWAQTDRAVCMHIYENHGFKPVRTSSLMKRSLAESSIEGKEDDSVRLREAQLGDDEEIATMTQLDNEAFKEHFNYRPMAVEETKYLLTGTPFYQRQKAWFALSDNRPVGYVVASIDERLNREKNARYGWISNIGVLKPYRRKELGMALMLRAMSFLKAQEMENALLYVDDQNPTNAMKLYEKVGFKIYHKNITYELQIA